MKERIQKNFHGYVTKADEGVVEAIVNVFGIVDYGNDIVQKGAFGKTIAERWNKILILDQHNTDSVTHAVAKTLAIRELEAAELPMALLAEYPEATGGLWVKMQFMLDDPKSAAIYTRIKNGLIGEYSIGFDIIQQRFERVEWRGQKVNARIISEVKLYEVSSVLWGMNQATATVSAKEYMPDGSVTQRIGDYLAACLFKAGNYSNDEFLSSGLTTAEEHAAISTAISSGVNMLLNALPEDVAIRPMDMGWGVMWWAHALVDESKALRKEGRMISNTNADRLRTAYTALGDILRDAGLIDTEPAADALGNPMMDDNKTYEQSGQESPLDNAQQPPALVEPPLSQSTPALTHSQRERLLAQINLEIEQLGG